MTNSIRNFKMKKLLIATTALVATAGMAAAEITITGHAAAGIHSGLDDVTTTANTTDNLIKRKQSLKATRRDLLDDLQADDDEIINNKPVSRK